jgi:hypothetical protein
MVAPKQWTRVDRWEIRCRFNRARLRERMEAGEFRMYVPKRKPIERRIDERDPLPPRYKFTCEWFYRDESLQPPVKVADGHFYEFDDGSTTEHDPKHLRLGNEKYALYSGTGWIYDILRDRTVLVKRHGLLYQSYVRWRRFTCARWGW